MGTVNKDEAFAFFEPGNDDSSLHPGSPIKVLAVDDDRNFQDSLVFSMRDFHYGSRPLEILRAGNSDQADLQLAAHDDIAVVFLDVMMETEDVGLRLVRSIRETLQNNQVRIVLLTGQPGFAPIRPTLADLDINEYWLKSELNESRLYNVLTAAGCNCVRCTRRARACR
jgi:diguanylate cyclase